MQIAREIGLKRVLKYFIFSLWQGIFNLLPFSPLRIWWLTLWGAKIGTDTVIDSLDFINLDRTGLSGLTIGDRCFIGRGTLLDLAGTITLENWVTISPRVTILSHTTVGFKHHPLFKLYPTHANHTKIYSSSFIGAHSCILGGITIGPQALIAAGSVVTTSIPQKSLAAGNPAVIKKRLKF